VVLAAAAVLLPQVRQGATAWLLAGVVGAAVGLVAAGLSGRRRTSKRRSIAAAVSVVLAFVGVAAWTGANSPRAGWFGALVSHGPRSRPRVALTFDDGPNVGSTLAVARLLDARGVKGTFFTVGKALAARGDISQALVDDGHLLGNHSYRHDSIHWLDPRYPELERTQQQFADTLGVCPALFRPPHGQHTPFMAHVAAGHGVRLVTWDVSAGDWATNDAGLIARRVLSGVRPGSIIDLHDGLDGNLVADRTVLLDALPVILDGLAARGLEAVRLDQLLGVPGWTACPPASHAPGGQRDGGQVDGGVAHAGT
jgi:peptidoglycan/xylan/chitin deacetylase (PgdA/CDA1 family)